MRRVPHVWRRRAGIALAVTLAAAALAVLGGNLRWHSRTRDLRAALAASRTAPAPAAFDPREIEGLPAPVRRFFKAALRPGQPLVAGAQLATEGEFLMDAAKDRWAPFTADQLFVARPPGFDWNARMRMAPGLFVLVRDAYRAGAGLLRAEALGVVTVASQEGGPDLAHGELLRWLAEACWFPTALLPSQGVGWEPIDENRARATLSDGGTTAALEFRFGRDGYVSSVYAAARPRTVDGRNVPTPWEGTWAAWSAQKRDACAVGGLRRMASARRAAAVLAGPREVGRVPLRG